MCVYCHAVHSAIHTEETHFKHIYICHIIPQINTHTNGRTNTHPHRDKNTHMPTQAYAAQIETHMDTQLRAYTHQPMRFHTHLHTYSAFYRLHLDLEYILTHNLRDTGLYIHRWNSEALIKGLFLSPRQSCLECNTGN